MEIIFAVLGSSAITAIIMAAVGRRKVAADVAKTLAEAEAIRSGTAMGEAQYYREQVEQIRGQMRALEAHVGELKATIQAAQQQYERRVGSLHTQMDNLATALERANSALDKANTTIAELQQEVRDGNIIITELRNQITSLLVKAEKDK